MQVLEAADAEQYRVFLLGALQEAPTAFVTSRAEIETLPLSIFEQLLSANEGADHYAVGAFSSAGELIGSIAAQRAAQRQLAHKGNLYRFYVAPGWRRRGIGRQLLQAAIDWAGRSRGLRFLDVAVTESSESARSLYRAAGFAPYALEPDAVRVDGAYYALESLRIVLNDGC
jgi:GNAT superfamily N-acetyltransferase